MRVKWEIVGLTLRGRLLDCSNRLGNAYTGLHSRREAQSGQQPRAFRRSSRSPSLVSAASFTFCTYQGGRVHCAGQSCRHLPRPEEKSSQDVELGPLESKKIRLAALPQREATSSSRSLEIVSVHDRGCYRSWASDGQSSIATRQPI